MFRRIIFILAFFFIPCLATAQQIVIPSGSQMVIGSGSQIWNPVAAGGSCGAINGTYNENFNGSTLCATSHTSNCDNTWTVEAESFPINFANTVSSITGGLGAPFTNCTYAANLYSTTSGSNVGFSLDFGSDQTDLSGRFYFNIHSIQDTSGLFAITDSAGTYAWDVRLLTTGQIDLLVPGGTTASTAPGAFTVDTPHYIDFKSHYNGPVSIMLDGNLSSALTGTMSYNYHMRQIKISNNPNATSARVNFNITGIQWTFQNAYLGGP